MLRKSQFIIGFLLLTFMISTLSLLPGCSKKDDGVIKIGVILPLTGEYALMGEWGKNGLELAAQHIKDKGLAPSIRQIELIFEDGLANQQASLSAFKKLTELDQVSIVISIVSSVDLAIIPEANKKQVLFLSHATHPSISSSGPTIFRHSPTVEEEVQLLLSEVLDDTGSLVLAYMNDDYGTVLADKFTAEIRNRGGLTETIMFDRGETDFRTIAAKIVDEKPSILIISGQGRNLGQLIVKLRESGYAGRTIVTLGFLVTGAARAAGEAIHGVEAVDFMLDRTESGFIEVNELYAKKYGSNIPVGALLFFNSLLLLNEAIQFGGTTPDKIASYLSDLSEFAGAGEILTITPSHDIVPNLTIIEL